MDAIAEGEFGVAQAFEKLFRETPRITERGKKRFAPMLGGLRGRWGGDGGAGHLTFAPKRSAGTAALCGADEAVVI